MEAREIYKAWLSDPYFDEETKRELEALAKEEKEIEIVLTSSSMVFYNLEGKGEHMGTWLLFLILSFLLVFLLLFLLLLLLFQLLVFHIFTP